LDQVVGADSVQSYGGKILLAELKQGFSTTEIITRMQAQHIKLPF
jgi:D-beta-D-heptose 7-phosphate kinase/D-beta-D-heptose 1-phosphate adenosyltransferase